MAEACLLFGWTPEACLSMRASLFFQLLVKGRALGARQRNRAYYELCMVAAYPTYTAESQRDVASHFYDASLSPADWAANERVRQQAEAEAAKQYKPSTAALDFFKSQARGLNGGR